MLAISKRAVMARAIFDFVAAQPDGATCDECLAALHLTHQSASARYHELKALGLIVPNGKKRRTRSGAAVASVHVVAPNADFNDYLTKTPKLAKKSLAGLSQIEQDALAVAMKFIDSWTNARTKLGRENAAVTLVTKLSSLTKK